MGVVGSIYSWLRQIITLFIISTFLVNVVMPGKYKEYIRLVMRIMLIIIIIAPVMKLFNNTDIFQKKLQSLYKEYSDTYYQDEVNNIQDYNYTVKDAVTQTVRLKVKNILNDYEVQYDDIEILIDDNNQENNKQVTISKIIIHIKKKKKTDIEQVKEKISNEIDIDYGNIYIKY